MRHLHCHSYTHTHSHTIAVTEALCIIRSIAVRKYIYVYVRNYYSTCKYICLLLSKVHSSYFWSLVTCLQTEFNACNAREFELQRHFSPILLPTVNMK